MPEHASGGHIDIANFSVGDMLRAGLGLLRSGELFTVIVFARTEIPVSSAARFRTIALDVRSALYTLFEDRTWKTD